MGIQPLISRLKEITRSPKELQMLKAEVGSMGAQIGELRSIVHGLKGDCERLKHFVELEAYCHDSLSSLKTPLRLPGHRMRIGCSYNMANNLFNIVKCLRRFQVDAELVLWRRLMDNSLLGDPRWETERLILQEFDQLRLNILQSPLPDYVKEIDPERIPFPCASVDTPFPKQLLRDYQQYHVDDYLAAMRQYDILLVSGIAVQTAPFVGKPYVGFPHGGDLYESPFREDTFGKLTRAGWRRAHANVFSGGHFFRYGRILGLQNTTYIPILIDTDVYRPPADGQKRRELLHTFDCERLFLSPARHNWNMKGNDRVIEAIAEVRKKTKHRFKVLFTSWGDDLEKSRALIHEKGIDEICIFVGTLSKGVLHEYMAAVDAVLDQFCIGEYGTATLEAMALARPVILFYRYENEIPILQSYSAPEIANQMLFVLEHPQKAEDVGQRARQWVIENHGPQVVIPKFLKVFEAVLNGEAIPQFPKLMAETP